MAREIVDTRRPPTPEEAYRLSFCIGANGQSMSSAERAQLVREVKWPPGLPPSGLAFIPPKPEPTRAVPPAPKAPGELEKFLKDMFPVLRPVPFKLLVGGAAALVGIVGILLIVGVVAGGSSIQAGDCVTTWTNPFNGNDHIDTASCSTTNAQRVLQVQNTSDGECYAVYDADTTFRDEVTGKTYCLGPNYGASQP
jgi:hypothetical protein